MFSHDLVRPVRPPFASAVLTVAAHLGHQDHLESREPQENRVFLVNQAPRVFPEPPLHFQPTPMGSAATAPLDLVAHPAHVENLAARDRRALKDPLDATAMLDPRDLRDLKELRAKRDPVDSLELQGPKETMEPEDRRDHQGLRDPLDRKGQKERPDLRDQPDNLETRVAVDLQDLRDLPDPRDSQETRDHRDPLAHLAAMPAIAHAHEERCDQKTRDQRSDTRVPGCAAFLKYSWFYFSYIQQ